MSEPFHLYSMGDLVRHKHTGALYIVAQVKESSLILTQVIEIYYTNFIERVTPFQSCQEEPPVIQPTTPDLY